MSKKIRSTFRRQPKIPGNTPPPLYYTNLAGAAKFAIRRLVMAALKAKT